MTRFHRKSEKVSLTTGPGFIINEAMFNHQYHKVSISKYHYPYQILSYKSQPKIADVAG